MEKKEIFVTTYRFHTDGNTVINTRTRLDQVSDVLAIKTMEDAIMIFFQVKEEWFEFTHFYGNNRYLNLEKVKEAFVKEEDIRQYIVDLIKPNGWINKVQLMMAERFGLYKEALACREAHLAKIKIEEEEEEKERQNRRAAEEEERRLEKEKIELEKQAKTAEDNQFLLQHADILKSDLSRFERLTVLKELRKRICFTCADGSKICGSYADMIKKHGYTKLEPFVKRYNRDGDKLATPKTSWYLSKPDELGEFLVPAPLGKLLQL